MKKPKWKFNFRIVGKFQWRFGKYIQHKLIWKDKFSSPRVDLIPSYCFSWAWFDFDFYQGNDNDWEWYLWVTEYSGNDLKKAKKTYPWGKYVGEKFIRSKPWLNYNK